MCFIFLKTTPMKYSVFFHFWHQFYCWLEIENIYKINSVPVDQYVTTLVLLMAKSHEIFVVHVKNNLTPADLIIQKKLRSKMLNLQRYSIILRVSDPSLFVTVLTDFFKFCSSESIIIFLYKTIGFTVINRHVSLFFYSKLSKIKMQVIN